MADASPDDLREIFKAAPFIANLGVELESAAGGECRTVLRIRREHLQQTGVVHAGVIATLADHTAGGAAWSVLDGSAQPLTVEFKVNLLRAAAADHLACRARVLKAGRNLVVAESEVHARADGSEEILVAKAIVTLAVVAGGKP